MSTKVASYFEDLRHRFTAASAWQITNAQQSLETMETLCSGDRPDEYRSAFFELAGINYLVWQMDAECDRFQVFVTSYNIPLGILRLSTKPSGTLVIAGFNIDLGVLATKITTYFISTPAEPVPAKPKRKVLLFGFSDSFGHHFWNEVGGLAASMATGVFDSLDGVVFGPFDYFNLEPLIKAKGKQTWKFSAHGALTLSDRLVIYTNNVVTSEARQLIINHAASQNAATVPHSRPSVCFQIRCHRRPWLNEEDGLIEIITALAREWPGMTFFIDGHSTSPGLTADYQRIIAVETLMAARLVQRLGDKIDVRSTIGMDMNAKINLFNNVDVFAGPIGSGGVLSSWLLRKPTICYGPTSTYSMVMYQEGIVPEGGPMVTLVPPHFITDQQDQASSYAMPTAPLLDLIREKIEELHPSLCKETKFNTSQINNA